MPLVLNNPANTGRKRRKRVSDVYREPGLILAIECAGTVAKLAAVCGHPLHTVFQWRQLPEELVLPLAMKLGIPRWITRPDLYAKPPGAKEWRLPPVSLNPRHVRAVEAYRRTGTLQAAAAEIGRSRQRLHQILHRYEQDTGESILLPREIRRHTKLLKVVEIYRQTKSLQQTAELLGRTPGSIRITIRRYERLTREQILPLPVPMPTAANLQAVEAYRQAGSLSKASWLLKLGIGSVVRSIKRYERLTGEKVTRPPSRPIATQDRRPAPALPILHRPEQTSPRPLLRRPSS
jgi:molybdenum-dependent DNA-binding transcriptional regulator ModE